nr:glycosyltransferase [Paenibacillus roseus]
METEHTAHSAAFIHQHADWIVGISSTTLRPFHHAGLDDKTTILFPSWDREDYQPRAWVENRAGKRAELGFHDGQRVIGYVAASIYRNKGFEHFMNMALQIGQRFPKAVFAVIGHPVDREYVEETFDLARAAGMMDRFRRIHFEQNIQSVYPAFDILVVPSLMPEGFGMTALEGMLFGKAVVAYDSGGLGEILNLTGNKKFLVPTGEVDGLIKKVARLLDDEKLLVQTGMRNSYNAQAVFGIAAYRKRLSHFLDLLAIKGHTPLHLVRGSSQSVYVLDRGRLRPFASEKAFLGHGHSFSNVRTITDEMLETFPLGDPILELPPASPARRRVRRRKLVKGKGKNQGKRKRGIGSGRGKRHARKKGVVRRKRNSAGAAGRKRTDKRRA